MKCKNYWQERESLLKERKTIAVALALDVITLQSKGEFFISYTTCVKSMKAVG